jgi:hypothetical protein
MKKISQTGSVFGERRVDNRSIGAKRMEVAGLIQGSGKIQQGTRTTGVTLRLRRRNRLAVQTKARLL